MARFAELLRTKRARDFWAHFAPIWENRGYVRRDDFLPETIPHLLGSLVLLERRAEGFIYRLVGSNIAGQHGRDLTGSSLGEWTSPVAATIQAQYDKVLADRSPILAHYDGPAFRGGSFEVIERRWEKLAFPLAFAGDAPDGVLVCACELAEKDSFPPCHIGPGASGCWCAAPGIPQPR
jgi:hypothetical protein